MAYSWQYQAARSINGILFPDFPGLSVAGGLFFAKALVRGAVKKAPSRTQARELTKIANFNDKQVLILGGMFDGFFSAFNTPNSKARCEG